MPPTSVNASPPVPVRRERASLGRESGVREWGESPLLAVSEGQQLSSGWWLDSLCFVFVGPCLPTDTVHVRWYMYIVGIRM